MRLIVATHRNLADEVKKGNFREDLYYRIIGLPIELPPLRERGSDVLILAKFFVDEFTKDNKIPALSIAPDAKDKLMQYHFPGNIRELKAMMDLACVMSNDNEIKAEDITYTSTREDEVFTMQQKTLRQYTCDIIKHFLKKYDDDVLMVAEKLDIGKSTIYKMIQQKEIII
jgi:DNA-binding NtrC family response regulator